MKLGNEASAPAKKDGDSLILSVINKIT